MQHNLKYSIRNSIHHIPYNEKEEQVVWNEEEGVAYLSFPALSEISFIQHGFSTRLGGVSKGHLSTMNLSYTRGDTKEYVDENYKRMCNALHVQTKDLVFSDQIHDTVVYHVTEKDKQGEELEPKKLIGIDGLITDTPNTVLCTSYADCVPLFFVDQKRKAIGLSHSGWRGTVGKIGKKTVEAMQQTFGSKPEDIVAVIGPSICRDCYEVSEDVAEAFQKAFGKEVAELILEEKKEQKYQLDLWLANQYILIEAGIPKGNISIASVCTCCNHEVLFSHRASQGVRGNLAAFLSIK